MADIETLPALLFPPKAAVERAHLQKLVKDGRVKKIGRRLYTSVPASQIARVVRDNWPTIIFTLYPKALLSHRSALEYKPTIDGLLILTGTDLESSLTIHETNAGSITALRTIHLVGTRSFRTDSLLIPFLPRKLEAENARKRIFYNFRSSIFRDRNVFICRS